MQQQPTQPIMASTMGAQYPYVSGLPPLYATAPSEEAINPQKGFMPVPLYPTAFPQQHQTYAPIESREEAVPAVAMQQHGGDAGHDHDDSVAKQPSYTREWWFRFVVLTAIAVNLVLLFIWLVAGHGFPWWIFPMCGIATGVAILRELLFTPTWCAKLFNAHLFTTLILNAMLIFTYLFVNTAHPWFIYTLAPTAGLLALHYLIYKRAQQTAEARESVSDVVFNIHLFAVFIPLNSMLFLCYVATAHHGTAKWFLYPLISTLAALLGHAALAHSKTWCARLLNFHLALTSCLNALQFVAWYQSGPEHFPWFVIILLLSIALFSLHYAVIYWREKVRRHAPRVAEFADQHDHIFRAAEQQPQQQQQSLPSNSNNNVKSMEEGVNAAETYTYSNIVH